MHVHNVIILYNVLCSVTVFRGYIFSLSSLSLPIVLFSSFHWIVVVAIVFLLLCSHSIYLLQFFSAFINFDYFLLLLLRLLPLLLVVILELWQAPACKIHSKCITTFFSRHIQRNVIWIKNFSSLVWLGVTMRWFSNGQNTKRKKRKLIACAHFRERERIQNGTENNRPDNNWSSRWIS